MVKHTQTILRLLPTNCLSEFDHFVGLVHKGLMSLQVTCERSFHLTLLNITKLLSSFTYNEQILQRLSVHLNNPFGCIKNYWCQY